MTRRTDRISATLTRALQEIIAKGLADPRVRGLITVTGVTVSPDLAEARVDVSVLPQSQQELTLHGLEAAAPHLRHELSEMVDMRKMPKLFFRLDSRLKKESAVLQDINRAARESMEGGERHGWSSAGSSGGQQSASTDVGDEQKRKERGA